MRILIVDDEAVALEALRHALTRDGHDVILAGSGHEALEVLRTRSCRFVISDWVMPGMDGLELCRRIRNEGCDGYTYVILLTSRGGSADIVAGLSAGADDFIAKPFDPAELSARVRVGERILALETRDVAIFAMAKLADSRDPETGAHLERMRGYTRILAQHLSLEPDRHPELDREFVRLIYLTSPLHDIGKIGIPDNILLKADRLDDREFEIMKTHTTIGAETLDAAAQRYPHVRFLRMARDIALTHHERFDGCGYPRRLAGEAIPLAGRIVALADAYDAITSKRVYKDAYTHGLARNILREDSGKHFDPDVVNAFLETEAQFCELRDGLASGRTSRPATPALV